MKNLLILTISIFTSVISLGQTFTYNGINYNVTGTTVEVGLNPSISGVILIPSTVTNVGTTYSVTSIGDYAFEGCTNLTSINIPNSVTSIGVYAFYNCIYLNSINIPNSTTNIGQGAFVYCSSLTSIIIPNSVTSIGQEVFGECSSLTSIIIPNSVTSIGDNAFFNCTNLTSINIPNSITSIGQGVFEECSSLISINIPNSVTSIGNAAFRFCSSLTSIIIPNSVTSIGVQAFYSCYSLTLVVIDNPLPLSIGNAFDGLTLNNVSLCIPIGSLSAYQGAPIWQDFNPISESNIVVPTFDPVPSYCSGATIPALPTTSTNGVTGTWSPALNPNATTLYTFTPTTGCAFAFLTITIQPLTASLTNSGVLTTSTCQGTLEATMIGGTAPYSYLFNSNPPQDSSTLINACAGFNYVTITDAAGCNANANYFLPYDSSSQPLTAFVLVSATSQTGVCDGEAEVFVTSGTAPYTFSHSSGTSTAIDSALCEGVYIVSVTDALGATVDLPYMVAADTNTLFIYQDDTSNAYNTTPIGAIENCNIDYSAIDSVTVTSVNSFAIDSVTVTWNVYSGGGVLEVIPVNYYIGFGLGYYNFILDVYCPTKSNGKFLKVTAKVNVSSLVNLEENANFITAVYPNPFTGNLTVSLAKDNQYSLSFYDISGRVLFSKKYDNTKLIELSDLDYLAKGEYLLHVQSAEGMIVRKVVK
jgi:hypothetical protein